MVTAGLQKGGRHLAAVEVAVDPVVTRAKLSLTILIFNGPDMARALSWRGTRPIWIALLEDSPGLHGIPGLVGVVEVTFGLSTFTCFPSPLFPPCLSKITEIVLHVRRLDQHQGHHERLHWEDQGRRSGGE